MVSLGYCTDLTHQSEIKALTVANIKGLLLVCPVPRASFLLSILIKCGSQGGSSLIMKEEMGAPEPTPGVSPVNIHPGTCRHQRQCSSGPVERLKSYEFFFSYVNEEIRAEEFFFLKKKKETKENGMGGIECSHLFPRETKVNVF